MTYARSGHAAFLYRTQREYLDCLLPFISESVQAEQAVLVAVPAPHLAVLTEGLGRLAERVVMTDMIEVGRNPGRILGEVLSGFVDKHADQPVRIVGEPMWPSRSEAEYPACVQHEVLINRAFLGRDVTVVCPYHVTQLGPEVIADAHRTHPVLWQNGAFEHDNASYAPEAMLAHYNQPLSSDPTAVRYTETQRSRRRTGVRRCVRTVVRHVCGPNRRSAADRQRAGDREPVTRGRDVPARAVAA